MSVIVERSTQGEWTTCRAATLGHAGASGEKQLLQNGSKTLAE